MPSRPPAGPPPLAAPGPMANPLAGNPLRTRADVERAALDLVTPLLRLASPGGARVRLGSSGVFFCDAAEELEGFARPLWGLVPLELGARRGGATKPRFADWSLYRRGLAAGSDPAHPEFWGFAECDQRMVEMAAIGFALLFLPEEIWAPLPAEVRERLVTWLDRIQRFEPHANNWHFFRVLVALGLSRVGRRFDAEALERSLATLESHFLGDGWYQDGFTGHTDYYVAWAYHTYGLLYAAAPGAAPDVAKRFRERARRFARDFQHFFDPEGRAVPFGRSLVYRFAQVAFFGALVFADEEALPWGRVKGIYLRHLRAWSRLPISDRDGVLSLGYGYTNLLVAEPYSSAGSPYWAMKAFLALAAPEEHPFWRAEEEPLPALSGCVAVPRAGMLLSRDASQALALSAGQTDVLYVNGPARYGKLAYSSLFGFGVAVHEVRPHQNVHDSMLALREEGGPWRVREESLERGIEDDVAWSRWRPFPDVEVLTLLTGAAPWHLRQHRVRTARLLHSAEAGFALPWDGFDPTGPGFEKLGPPHAPLARSPYGVSGVRDLDARRTGAVWMALPNTNVMWRRTVVPLLHAELAPGVHDLACAVAASDRPETVDWEAPPPLPEAMRRILRDLEGPRGGD